MRHRDQLTGFSSTLLALEVDSSLLFPSQECFRRLRPPGRLLGCAARRQWPFNGYDMSAEGEEVPARKRHREVASDLHDKDTLTCSNARS